MNFNSTDFFKNYIIYLLKNLKNHGVYLHNVTIQALIDSLIEYNNEKNKFIEIIKILAEYEILIKNPQITNKYKINYNLNKLQIGGYSNIEITFDEIKNFVNENKNILNLFPKYNKITLDKLKNIHTILNKDEILKELVNYKNI